MAEQSTGEKTPDDSVEMGEIPILLPFRYDPEAEGRCERSPTSDVSPASPSASQQSRFSFGRKARGMVDSLLPEPLKTRNVTQKREVKVNQLPANIANESYAAIYNEPLHQARPSSSVYDDDLWPDLTSSSENTWPCEGSSAGKFKSRFKDISKVHNESSGNPRQLLAGTAGIKLDSKQPHVSSDHGYHSPSRKPSHSEKALPSLPSAERSNRQILQNAKTGNSIGVKKETAFQHSPDQFGSLADTKTDVYSQLTALRVPIRRRHEPRLPSTVTTNTDAEDSSLLQSPATNTDEAHIPFDPIDPYHRSGQPKKKVLYGPDGYLGKDKEWKQSSIQKMTEKVESLGNRVKRGIQRSMERDRDDNRMELLHGIVMKPSISINVDPEAQSEIYSKLELSLCTSANAYLLAQMKSNRFVGNDSVKRFVNFWNSKNRPLVPEFQFDLKTQREIIVHNVRTFDFPGKYGLDPVLLKATLDGWGSVVNQLNVRTYCWPDSAIRKLFHDVYPVLEMLGASNETIATFLDMKHLVMGLIHHAKYKKRMEELKRGSSRRYQQ